eukprot:4364441-Pyramimonas_sp.AAC.1
MALFALLAGGDEAVESGAEVLSRRPVRPQRPLQPPPHQQQVGGGRQGVHGAVRVTLLQRLSALNGVLFFEVAAGQLDARLHPVLRCLGPGTQLFVHTPAHAAVLSLVLAASTRLPRCALAT